MFFGFLQFRQCIDIVHFPIQPDAHESLCTQLIEQFRLFTLASGYYRRKYHQTGVGRQLQNLIDHL